jgi:hypothetical protein
MLPSSLSKQMSTDLKIPNFSNFDLALWLYLRTCGEIIHDSVLVFYNVDFLKQPYHGSKLVSDNLYGFMSCRHWNIQTRVLARGRVGLDLPQVDLERNASSECERRSRFFVARAFRSRSTCGKSSVGLVIAAKTWLDKMNAASLIIYCKPV